MQIRSAGPADAAMSENLAFYPRIGYTEVGRRTDKRLRTRLLLKALLKGDGGMPTEKSLGAFRSSD